MRLSRLGLASFVVFAASMLAGADARAGDFYIESPQMGKQYQKNAPIACSGGATFFNEPYTLELVLQDPVKGPVVVDSYQGKSNNINGSWSHTFQSTQQNLYPAGTYYVMIYSDNPDPDDGVEITLTD